MSKLRITLIAALAAFAVIPSTAGAANIAWVEDFQAASDAFEGGSGGEVFRVANGTSTRLHPDRYFPGVPSGYGSLFDTIMSRTTCSGGGEITVFPEGDGGARVRCPTGERIVYDETP